MKATESTYNKVDIATKLLPTAVALTIDPDKEVRDNAFKCVNNFLEKLSKVSESGAADVPETSTPSVSTGMLGWAFNSLTKKIIGDGTSPQQQQQQQQQVPQQQQPQTPSRSASEVSISVSTSNTPSTARRSDMPEESVKRTSSSLLSKKVDDGWDNEDALEFDDDNGDVQEKSRTVASTSTTTSRGGAGGGKGLSLANAPKAQPKKASGWDTGDGWDNDDDDEGKLLVVDGRASDVTFRPFRLPECQVGISVWPLSNLR
jgi:SCY1-like protein 1